MSKPFKDAGNFTVFYNPILEEIMPLCSPNTWKILCATIRKTIGWHKESDWISISQYMKLTGIKGRKTCCNAINDAVDKNYLLREPYRNSFKYRLNVDFEIGSEMEPAEESEEEIGSESELANGSEMEHTKETNTKQINNKRKKKEKVNPFTEFQTQYVDALDLVTTYDKAMRYSYLSKIGKQLFSGGYTPKQVLDCFGKGSVWFTKFPGKNGDKPNPQQIVDRIKEYSKTQSDTHDPDEYTRGALAGLIES